MMDRPKEFYRRNIVGFTPDDSPLPPRPGHLAVTIYSSFNERYAPLASIAIPNWKRYCERHGYRLRFYENGYHEDPRFPKTYGDKGKFSWYYEMRGWNDLLMWLDIDSMFVDLERPIPYILAEPFMWTYDQNGPASPLLIARTDDITERHLRFAYEQAVIENNVRHGRIEPNGISDQDSMRRLMNMPPFKATFGRPVPFPHDWIFTCPGGTFEEKKRSMEQYVDLT